jgi:hypothetical protein
MRRSHWISGLALAAAVATSGCRQDGQAVATNSSGNTDTHISSTSIPSGTSIGVTINSSLSSKTANIGDSWSGSVAQSSNGLPVGSLVSGTVTAVKAAKRGDRAMLDLGLTSITVGEHRYTVHGSTEAIIAGSPRARNLGAIAGSAAGGALIGKVATGRNKGAVIGGLIGAGVATGIVAASDGYQVVLKPGTVLTFTTSEVVAVRF